MDATTINIWKYPRFLLMSMQKNMNHNASVLEEIVDGRIQKQKNTNHSHRQKKISLPYHSSRCADQVLKSLLSGIRGAMLLILFLKFTIYFHKGPFLNPGYI